MEVLIKYCMNSFPQVYEFKFLFTSCAFPIGQSVLKRNLIGSFKSNRKLINFLSNELINLRKELVQYFINTSSIASTVRNKRFYYIHKVWIWGILQSDWFATSRILAHFLLVEKNKMAAQTEFPTFCEREKGKLFAF
jgi:hypothetical protein